ncbi:MAG: NACHT domain-containing protein [Thermoanaerobaculia bacterium]|nr:NACHT domain-containing protein [Thermoanaerobaculia bacterium]
MRLPTRKSIFIVLLAMVLVVGVAVVPDIISEDLRAWCLSTFGEGYQGYLLVFFVVGSVILLFLTTDIGNWLRPSATPSKPDRFNIPPGAATRKQINLAKTAISEAEPEQALRHLSDLKVPALDTEIATLSSRYAEYRRSSRQGINSRDEENRTYNRITKGILDLIKTLESELATGTENYQTIKDYLKKRYTNRLGQKLAKRQPVNLRRIPSTEGTSYDRAAAFIPYSSDEVAGTMAQNFRDARGRLLIVGAPGAGKTTLLLQLVLDLLNSEPDALPVLLNLATWSSEYITLEAWLKKILPAELGISEKYAQEIIQQGRLILLLDGFDEILFLDQADCLEAIGRYGEDAGRQFVISSRIDEYKAVAKDAPVYWQIEVGPLSIEQLEAELNRLWETENQPESRALLQAIQKDALLRQAAETPFYFNTLQILFSGGKTLTDLHFTANTLEDRQTEVLERFIQYELKVPGRQEYSPEKVKHWLSFLASRMTQRNMVVFELRDLQYDWWRWTKQWLVQSGLVAGLTNNIIGGIIGGLIFGLIGGLVFKRMGWLFTGLLLGLIFMVEYGLIGFLISGLITTLIFRLVGELVFNLAFRMVFGMGYGLLMGLTKGLLKGLQKRMPIIITNDRINLSWNNVYHSIGNVSQVILIFWLFGAMFTGEVVYTGIAGLIIAIHVILNKSDDDLIQIHTPYHRFTASAKALHFSILQHLLLRYQLYKQGLLPLRLVDFLNALSLRHILEFDGDPTTGKGGGAWRFRHRILQEWFAGRWGEPR